MPLVAPAVSAESPPSVGLLTEVISSLLGRNFFSAVLEDFEDEVSLGFDAVILGNAAPSLGLDFVLASGIDCIECINGSVVCSVFGWSFCIDVALDDKVGRTGTTGLIAELVVTLR